jgi:hypothetical protein
MPYAFAGALHLAIAIYFAIHAMRTGRPWYWLMILLSFPLIGSAIYFFVEYLPDMRYSRGGRRVLNAVNQAIDPNRELRAAEADFERAPTVQHRATLASVLTKLGRYDEAIAHYREAASGAYANDQHFVRGLASTSVLGQRWGDARSAYERLFALGSESANPTTISATPMRSLNWAMLGRMRLSSALWFLAMDRWRGAGMRNF